MSWIRRVTNVFRPERLSRDIQREMDFHLEERTDDLVAAGASPESARREAVRRLGHSTTQRERARDMDVAAALDAFVSDVRYAFRALSRTPGYTIVAVLSLALGIGANTAIFSVVDAVMLRSLPVRNPEQLARILLGGADALTNPMWEQLRDAQSAFGQALAFGQHGFSVTTAGESRPLDGDWVSGDYFRVLGVGAAVGRAIDRADDWRGCPAIAMLSYAYWQSDFGGRPDVIGRSLVLDSHPFQVVGVAAEGFDGVEVGAPSRVFVPLCAEAVSRGKGSSLDRRSTWWLTLIARPAAGTTLAQLNARLATLSPRVLAAAAPQSLTAARQKEFLAMQFKAEPAPTGTSSVRTHYGHALYVLLGAVGLVLLIACVNVANLLLARAAAREHELAIRSALGAGRSRLVRQLLTESAVLAALGALLGLVLARLTTSALAALLASIGRRVTLVVHLDGRILAFTLGITLLTGLLFGLAPAWRSALVNPRASLTSNPRQMSGGQSRFTAAKLLVAAQVALLLPLLVGAGLMMATLRNLTRLDPGFQADGVVLMAVDAQHAQTLAKSRRASAYEDILARIRALPGVSSASASDITPIGTSSWNDFVAVDGYSPRSLDDSLANFNEISSDYFGTIRTRVLLGRDFSPGDRLGAPPAVIVNEALVRKFFRGQNPIGRVLRVGETTASAPPMQVVGVVEDAKYGSLRDPAPPTAYIALAQDSAADTGFNFEIRTTGGVNGIRAAALAAVHQVNSSLDVSFSSFEDQVSRSLGVERLLARLSTIFGALALGLAMIGLYGVMSYNVVRRRGEIGIRLALGASRAGVRRLVMRDVARVVLLGLAIGFVAVLYASRALKSAVYGLAPNDPVTIAVAIVALVSVAAIAGYLPARRASRGDPMLALRQE